MLTPRRESKLCMTVPDGKTHTHSWSCRTSPDDLLPPTDQCWVQFFFGDFHWLSSLKGSSSLLCTLIWKVAVEGNGRVMPNHRSCVIPLMASKYSSYILHWNNRLLWSSQDGNSKCLQREINAHMDSWFVLSWDPQLKPQSHAQPLWLAMSHLYSTIHRPSWISTLSSQRHAAGLVLWTEGLTEILVTKQDTSGMPTIWII